MRAGIECNAIASGVRCGFSAVALLMPNVLRVFCLHFVSSKLRTITAMLEPGNAVQQTQVWNACGRALHAFCSHFGATHAIHHFVVRESVLYTVPDRFHRMYPLMREHGVRFNDLVPLRVPIVLPPFKLSLFKTVADSWCWVNIVQLPSRDNRCPYRGWQIKIPLIQPFDVTGAARRITLWQENSPV